MLIWFTAITSVLNHHCAHEELLILHFSSRERNIAYRKNIERENLKYLNSNAEQKTVDKSGLVELSRESGGLVRIRLQDPERLNALSTALADAFEQTVNSLIGDETLRVLVLTGAGRAFSAGGDLEMLEGCTRSSAAANQALMENFYGKFLSVRKIPVPVIAAINGHAIGAGLCLAMACDIRIAKRSAKLGLNFVQLGLHPGMGATWLLPRIVGAARARELLFSGEVLSAERALEVGLVHAVTDDAAFEKEVSQKAAQILSAGGEVSRKLKVTLNTGEEDSLKNALKREASCQAEDYLSAEFKERLQRARDRISSK